jgi:UDP-2-acetamido-3-amino-2,3-dideoxy-glucuronate N-acetyltransferase
VKLGVAGAGHWGKNIIRVCRSLGVLESVCDANEAALFAVAKEYDGIALECEFAALLERPIDGVIVAAPAALHGELALQALAAGKHVFVEKPLAMSFDEASAVVRAASAAQRTLFVGHLLLYHPAVRRLLDLIREGAIGDVQHVRSRRLSFGRLRAHENVWWSFAPHDVALVLEIFGALPHSVRGSTSAFVRPHIADFAYADMLFPHGCSAHVEVGWLDPDKNARLDVFGSRGTLRMIDARDGSRLWLTPCGARRDAFGRPELYREEGREISVTPAEPLAVELAAFVEAVRTGRKPLTDGEEGLRVVQVLGMLGERVVEHPTERLEAVR